MQTCVSTGCIKPVHRHGLRFCSDHAIEFLQDRLDRANADTLRGGRLPLRDWFAGQALPQAVEDYGQPSEYSIAGQRCDRGNPVLPWATKGIGTREEIIARQAYRYADAMLAARANIDEGEK